MLNPVVVGGPAALEDAKLRSVVDELQNLGPMDKATMSGRCVPQTVNMERFMASQMKMRNIPDEVFCQGVRAFSIGVDLDKCDPAKVLEFKDYEQNQKAVFRISTEEVLRWQRSFKCYVADDIYKGADGDALLMKSLKGHSDAGDEAWRMKFAIRISQTPIFMTFNGKVVSREVADHVANNCYLVSVCGMDFAGRNHDVLDTTRYITNWRDVYELHQGVPHPFNGRDFFPTGVPAQLDGDLLSADLKKMARLRLRAQNEMGIQVVVETGIGLGVFSGDQIGIGPEVRTRSALALRAVLEEDTAAFARRSAGGASAGASSSSSNDDVKMDDAKDPQYLGNIKLIVCALPAFKRLDNYHYFVKVFQDYKGRIPVVILDNDMHEIALVAAKSFVTSELNPADSHGVFGEYWQNRGPGTEEKLALTTGGLLTQHHAVNPHVLDASNYVHLNVTD